VQNSVELAEAPAISIHEYRQLTAELLSFLATKEAEKLKSAITQSTNATPPTAGAAATATATKGITNQQMTTRSSHVVAPATNSGAAATGTSKKSKGKKEKESAEEWVQCDLCARWRLLPPPSDPLYPTELPDKWICTMNTWNPTQAMCSIPEETTGGSEVNTQRALKLR
jgi:hypothetical protein